MIGLMKDELGGKITTDFATLIPKIQSYLTDDINENEKGKDTKTCIIKRKMKLQDCKPCFEATQLGKKIKQLEKKLC